MDPKTPEIIGKKINEAIDSLKEDVLKPLQEDVSYIKKAVNPRIERHDVEIKHIKEDVSEIKKDLKTNSKEEKTELKDEVKHKKRTKFEKFFMITIILVSVGTLLVTILK